jgi:hypothetical protein
LTVEAENDGVRVSAVSWRNDVEKLTHYSKQYVLSRR